VAVILASHGTEQYLQHKIRSAESYLNRAVAIWKKSAPVNSNNYLRTLQNLGQIYLEQHKYEKAGALFAEALTEWDNSSGASDLDVAHALGNLAVADVLRGYYAEAEPLCQRALGILEKSSPLDYTRLVIALLAYARVLRNTNRIAQAEILETRAMVYKAKLKSRPEPAFDRSLN
jgi:tetratricopeptide (TPR) repeat protein